MLSGLISMTAWNVVQLDWIERDCWALAEGCFEMSSVWVLLESESGTWVWQEPSGHPSVCRLLSFIQQLLLALLFSTHPRSPLLRPQQDASLFLCSSSSSGEWAWKLELFLAPLDTMMIVDTDWTASHSHPGVSDSYVRNIWNASYYLSPPLGVFSQCLKIPKCLYYSKTKVNWLYLCFTFVIDQPHSPTHTLIPTGILYIVSITLFPLLKKTSVAIWGSVSCPLWRADWSRGSNYQLRCLFGGWPALPLKTSPPPQDSPSCLCRLRISDWDVWIYSVGSSGPGSVLVRPEITCAALITETRHMYLTGRRRWKMFSRSSICLSASQLWVKAPCSYVRVPVGGCNTRNKSSVTSETIVLWEMLPPRATPLLWNIPSWFSLWTDHSRIVCDLAGMLVKWEDTSSVHTAGVIVLCLVGKQEVMNFTIIFHLVVTHGFLPGFLHLQLYPVDDYQESYFEIYTNKW